MDSMMRSAGLVAVLVLTMAGAANAGVIGINDAAIESAVGAGDDGLNISRDLTNGLDWLDWTLTTNTSYADLTADLLAAGKPLESWRFATDAEFDALLVSAGVLLAEDVPGSDAALETLAALVGVTHPDAGGVGTDASAGFSAEVSGGSRYAAVIFAGAIERYRSPDTHSAGGGEFYTADAWFGAALVRDVQAVPLPSAAWLGLGLLALAGALRGRRAA